jgi:hypothetical protein
MKALPSTFRRTYQTFYADCSQKFETGLEKRRDCGVGSVTVVSGHME